MPKILDQVKGVIPFLKSDSPDERQYDTGMDVTVMESAGGSFEADRPSPRRQQQQPPKQISSICCRALKCIIFMGILVTIVLVVLSKTLMGTVNPAHFFIPLDPPGLNETYVWQDYGSGNGLSLRVENALDEKWVSYFDEYIQRWDDGTPDALTLTPIRVEVDPVCDVSGGRLKVCNSNYGRTDWKGVNINLLRNGYIAAGVSKMNDYFLDKNNAAEKRYVMCHELGHGFGLPHTDENYYNLNRGDCMDYTLNPRGNLSPGAFNFELLAEVYGTVPTNNNRRRMQQQDSTNMIDDPLLDDSFASELVDYAVEECQGGLCVTDFGDGTQVVVQKLLA